MDLPTLAIDSIIACADLEIFRKLITPASHGGTVESAGTPTHRKT